MMKKIIGILIMTLLITTFLPGTGAVTEKSSIPEVTYRQDFIKQGNSKSGLSEGWALQWSHAYGGMGHSQLAQPVGDIDEDGVNEFIIGGYENSGMCRILSYDAVQETYVQEYSWYVPGGSYHIPTGACVYDVNEDGHLEFCVSWGFTGADGVYTYKWDGTTLTTLDWYNGIGVDFIYDVFACDYNDDGHVEVLIANAPNMGTSGKHVIALRWDNDHFVSEAYWTCPGGLDKECPMVWGGDVDNDGKTEVIADVSNSDYSTAGTWALNWNDATESWDAVPVCTNYPGSTVYGDGIADIDGDGTLEIGVGSYGGTPSGWLFEWDGSEYKQVWHGEYPGGEPVIESVALGDADNDGNQEFVFGTETIHIIGWNGEIYYEKATLNDPKSMLAGMNIGDFDTDGLNELKACEILSGTGSEFIFKYYDKTPPITTIELEGEMEGDIYISDVPVHLNATDDHSIIVYTMYKLDEEEWQEYENPFVVSGDGEHNVKFYSVDNYGNEEEEKFCTFTIKHPSYFEIEIPKGFGIGLKAKITEVCNEAHTGISWKFDVSGAKVIPISPLQGKADFSAGETKIIRSQLVIGLGSIHITLAVDDCDLISANAFIIGVFVYIF
jgi:hypothetical protein